MLSTVGIMQKNRGSKISVNIRQLTNRKQCERGGYLRITCSDGLTLSLPKGAVCRWRAEGEKNELHINPDRHVRVYLPHSWGDSLSNEW